MSAVGVLTGVAPHLEAQVAVHVEAGQGLRLVRRCADLEELLSAGAARVAATAVVSADLPGLDRGALSHLEAHGLLVVGVHLAGDEEAQRRLRQLGVRRVLPTDAAPDAWVEALRPSAVDSGALDPVMDPMTDVVTDRDTDSDTDAESTAASRGRTTSSADGPDFDVVTEEALRGWLEAGVPPTSTVDDGSSAAQDAGRSADESARTDGQVIAVWGPTGAPGRTTVAVTVAAELARLGSRVVLVDADTYGGCIGQCLGLLDEAPGLAAAVRLADSGDLDLPRLAALAPEVGARLRVLTGLPTSERWSEIRDDSYREVLRLCRRLADVVVVDAGFCLEEDEELSYDTRAPRRNATTTTSLREADRVLAVGAAEPVSLQRLVRGLDRLQGFTSSPQVVVTRVRSSAVGSGPTARVAEALERFAGVHEAVLVPDDRAAFDAAMLAGRTVTESAPGSAARHALAALAAQLVGSDARPRKTVLAGSRARRLLRAGRAG